jgi:hypothetical protein
MTGSKTRRAGSNAAAVATLVARVWAGRLLVKQPPCRTAGVACPERCSIRSRRPDCSAGLAREWKGREFEELGPA